jgi:hypothetical protein
LYRLKKSKKGVSAIIGYVLLILLAVSLSGGVYAWLKAKIPKATEKCPEDVSLEIIDLNVDQLRANITLEVRNRGLFSVNGIKVRLKEDNKACKIRTMACANCTRFITGQDQVMFIQKLDPQEIRVVAVGFFKGTQGCDPTAVEIVPLRVVGEGREAIVSICENSIFTEKLK